MGNIYDYKTVLPANNIEFKSEISKNESSETNTGKIDQLKSNLFYFTSLYTDRLPDDELSSKRCIYSNS